MNRTSHLALAASLTALVSASGCQLANTQLRADFTDFNASIQSSQLKQLLLNLVRMHYRDTPLFMQVGSLTASYEDSVTGNGFATAQAGDQSAIGIGGSVTFSSKPTISYTPVEGKDYVQQFMTEVSPQTFAMLLRAGWSVSKLGTLVVAFVETSSGQRLSGRIDAASHGAFVEFFKALEEAQAHDDLSVVNRSDGGIDLRTSKHTIALEKVQFRSLFSAMFSLSHDVQTDPLRATWAKSTEGGNEIDVRVSATAPLDALVFVEYAGAFYSVGNDDLRSKDTLALLMELSRMQSGPAAAAPLVTIPAR